MRKYFLLALIAVPALGSAATTPAQKDELNQLRNRIEALQKRLAASEDSKTEAADSLRDSEQAISEANRNLRELAGQQHDLQAQLAQLQNQSGAASAAIGTQQEHLARLLYQRYTGAQPDMLKLLLNSADPNQIARDLHYLTYLARARAEMISSLRASLQRLDDMTHEARQRADELAAVQAEQQAQRKRLEDEKRARQQVLLKVSRQIQQQRREISTLKRDEARLAKLVERLTQMLARSRPERSRSDKVPDGAGDGSPFAQLKGRLHLPVRGELRGRFGSPRQDSGLSWKGLFIAAPAGQEVKAVAAGRVVFADWLRGFGNLLIIDHGGGYMSLYGNNESIYKRVGDTPQGGETVAAVGNSGGNSDSGLYFEIRYQGKAFDPLTWISIR